MPWFKLVSVLLLIAIPSVVWAEDDDPPLPPAPLLPAEPVPVEQWIQLTDEPGSLYHTRWSPDGKWIGLTHNVDDDYQLQLLDVATGEIVPLEIGLTGDLDFDWSPDSTHLVFDAYPPEGPPLDIWTVDIDSLEVERITRLDGADFTPAWSPAGDQLAFVSSARNALVIADVHGQIVQDLVENQPGMWPFHPVWSPDGEWMVFSAQNNDGDTDLWLIAAEGGEPRALTTGPAWDDRVRWSPDGEWIVFMSDRSGSEDIWALAIATGELVQITAAPGDESFPCWSPDGTQLVFTVRQDDGRGQVYLIDLAALGS